MLLPITYGRGIFFMNDIDYILHLLHIKTELLSHMKKITLSILLLVFTFLCKAQMVVTQTTPADIVLNHLLGTGVFASNISYQGNLLQFGSFTGGTAGIDSGAMLNTGKVGGPWAPASNFHSSSMNNNSDPSLALLVAPGTSIRDAAVLKFDFKVASDSVKFNFVFSSEEYNEYVDSTFNVIGTGFNDVFGFFISGPGIVGEQNIALIPGTTIPVSIFNVNNGSSQVGVPPTGPCQNCAYFIDNTGGATFAGDAYTTVLTAQVAVQPCTVYHIKLAIADAGDQVWDSFVMLEDNSFQACPTPPPLWINNSMLTVDSVFVCQGNSVSISSVKGPNYLWSTGATTQTISVSQTGDYVATVYEGTCNSISKTIHVEVSNIPTPVLTNAGAVITSSIANAGYTYVWYKDGNLITGANAPTYTVSSAGCYVVTVTDASGCVVTSNPLCLTFTGVTFVEESNAAQLIPNPFNQNARLTFKNPNKEKMTLIVYDASGKQIMQDVTTNALFDIKKGNLQSGIYSYTISNSNRNVVYKGKMVIE